MSNERNRFFASKDQLTQRMKDWGISEDESLISNEPVSQQMLFDISEQNKGRLLLHREIAWSDGSTAIFF